MNLLVVNILLGLSIVAMAVAVSEGLVITFVIAIMCTVFAGANRHYELARRSKG